jgi:hypothetical protein
MTSMPRKTTTAVREDVARWARRKKADENTSVSKLVRRMLEDRMRQPSEYRRLFAAGRKLARYRELTLPIG